MRARLIPLWRTYRVDVLLSALFFAVALLVRLPNLQSIPRFTDEAQEVLWGWDIALGRRLPLTAVDAYYGPLFAYSIAALFRIIGPNPFLPRLFIAVFGALTVVATYGLGRITWNRHAGIVAGILALTSPTLVAISSHYGWSNSLTPFFFTATLVALLAGIKNETGWLVALSGLLAALTLQTHPSTIAALVGIALAFVVLPELRGWLKRKPTYFAVALFLLGYAPMIIANVGVASPMLQDAERRSYAFGPTLMPMIYARRMGAQLQRLLLVIGGWLPHSPGIFWLGVALFGIATVAGLALMWRTRHRLLPVIVVTCILLFPTFLRNYTEGAHRYLAFLAPVACVALGALAVALARIFRAVYFARWRIWAAMLVLLALVSVYQLVAITRYYEGESARAETNDGMFRLVEVLRANGACQDGIYVQRLRQGLIIQTRYEAQFNLISIDYLLTLASCQHMTTAQSEIIRRLRGANENQWLVIPRQAAPTYATEFQLEPIESLDARSLESIAPFVLYRVVAGR